MAKQSWKQQMYEQIANSQVQQVMQQQRDQGIAQLQAEFDAWQKQQNDIAQLQAEYDSWYAQNNPQPVQPIQTAPVQTVKKEEPKQEAIPSLADYRTTDNLQYRQAKRDIALGKKRREDYQRQQQEEQMKAEGNKPIYGNGLNTSIKQLDLSAIQEEMNKASEQQKEQQNEDLERQILNADRYVVDNTPQLTDEQKALEEQIANFDEYQVNKSSPEEGRKKLAAFGWGVSKIPFLASELIANGIVDAGESLGQAGAIALDDLTGHHDDHENLEKVNDYWNAKRAQVEDNIQWTHDSQRQSEEENPLAYGAGKFATQAALYAVTNPLFDKVGSVIGAGAGKLASTLGASEKAAGIAGKAASIVGNQLGQNLQDVALDTIPRYNELKALGMSDEEIKDTLVKEGLYNAAGNAFFGAVSEVPGLVKKFNNKSVPVPQLEDVDNVVRNATRQAEEATQNIENISKQMPEIPENVPVRPGTAAPVSPSIENAAEEISKAMDVEEAAKAIEPPKAIEAPKTPELVEPETPKLLSDDVEAQLAYDFENIGDSYYGNRAAIKESLESKDFSIPNTAINDVPGKNGKMQYEIVDLDGNRTIKTFASRKAAEKAQAEYAAGNVLKEKAIKAFDDLDGAIYRYEKAAYNSADVEEVNTAKKAVEAARKRYERAMKEYDPSYYDAVSSKDFGDRIARPYYTRNPAAENPVDEALVNDLVNDWVDQDINNPNRFVRDAEPDNTNVYRGANNVPGAEPLQTFGAKDGPKDQWKTSKARTNTFENQGWGDKLPERNYAYRVQSTADTHEIKAERYKGSDNIANDLLDKDYDTFDAADVKASMETIQELMDNGDVRTARRLSERLAHEGRESGRTVQAFAEYNKNTAVGALQDAQRAQDDFVLDPWRSKNKKAREGNSRIAKALADMGHKPDAKIRPELTHDQIKNGVIAELNREVGSVEKYFNDNDIEFLTQMAEDKSIPVWQITSEIEHKLNTGSWYTLDESVAMPKPTNRKLQNALDSLVTETVRAESVAPSLKQITEEVRNTLGKESADFDGLFTDDDIEYLANLIHEGASKDELADALDMKLATGSFGISDETLQEVNNIFKQISNYDPNSKQFVEGQAEAYRLLANEILPNATLKEKFEAWRYIAMLGNPKTMLRNYIGNQTFNVVTGISNNIAAIAEAGIDKASKALGGEGIQRTKAILNPVTDSGLIKACAEDADASRYRQIIGSKYEKMSKDTLRRSKSVFNSKLAQLYEKVTDAGISDYSAVKKKYSTSLAGYMKANGMSTDIFKAEDELRNLRNLSETRLLSDAEKARVATLSNQVQELEKARDYALKQAEYATFHEDNKIADVLSKWSRTSKEEGTGIGHLLIEGVVPFKKTPANVLKSGYHYSPLGAIDSIKKTGKLIYENTGVRKGNLADVYKNKAGKDVARTLASDVIDSWSKTLTGTGLTALGIYLYNKGILHSSDPDTKYQDELEGHQNYAIEINGKSYTIDWAAPTIMPLMIGAEIAKVWDSTGKGDEDLYNNLDDYIALANRLADPLVETSMLSGVKDTLDTAASAAQNNENLNIPALLIYNTLTGYASQGVPTIAGQIARTIDPTRRSTYTDKESAPGILDKQLKKQMNKIPGLSMLNQPYVDTYGREQQNGPFNNPLARLGYQMFSPGYLTNINETDADRISREAYEVGNVANTLPKWQSKFKDAEGNRVSPEDYTTASKAYGQANYEIREALANDEWFNSLEGTQKEEIVKGINTIAEHVGNAAIDPNYTKDSKAYNAYKDGGIPGLLDYYKGENAKDIVKESGLSTTSKVSKEIQQDIKNGNTEVANQKLDEATTILNAGINAYGYDVYKTNKANIKNTDDWISEYNKIDGLGNSDGFVNQEEFIKAIKKNNWTEDEAVKYAKIYGTWKQIPYLKKDGTWGFHKVK